MARKKTRSPKKSTAGRQGRRRASWQGQLTFSLVTVQVEAWNAINREHSDIHFHQVHAACHNRIHYKKVCPVHGEISNDEIVSAYEVSKNKYVEVTPDELDALRSESEKALTVQAFVTPDAVDPLYFDGRMYYLVPKDKGAEMPYAVLVEAMEREKRYAIATVVFSGKDQLVLVRPIEGVLHMAMLNYEAEIRSPKTVAAELKRPAQRAREVKLAEKLIEQWSDDHFDFSRFHDPYREKVQELIDSKKAGREIEPPAEPKRDVLDLMEALKKSVAGLTTTKGKRKGSRKSA